MLTKISSSLWDRIRYYAKFAPTGVSLRQMVVFGANPSPKTVLRGTFFLRQELPIRLAQRVVELDNLPRNLSLMPSIIKVKNWYAESFKELVEMPPFQATRNGDFQIGATDKENRGYYAEENQNDEPLPESATEYNASFVDHISRIKRRHDAVVTTMAQGIRELKDKERFDVIPSEVQQFLDRFYLSRIGIRMLIGQHIALNERKSDDSYVGIICTRTNIHDIALEAVHNARFICEDHYALFKAPEVLLYCPKELTFMYVPSHLHHMLFELLKNSLRAVVETFGVEAEDFPPIKLVVAEGKEDITIKIADEGGGIARSGMPLIWTYFYTTAEAPVVDPNFRGPDLKAPMAGLGYGLPLARLYARYFGGDLRLISMEGYGTDAYLHLNRLSDSEEFLP